MDDQLALRIQLFREGGQVKPEVADFVAAELAALEAEGHLVTEATASMLTSHLMMAIGRLLNGEPIEQFLTDDQVAAELADHPEAVARARAVENQAYVLACGTAGTHAGTEQAGRSVVVDPWGEVLAEAGTDEEILTVDFDPSTVAATRDRFPALKDRRLGLAEPKEPRP
ncbi:nitrilase-related carbon-nitrogen hydrolase [Streptomyces sp. McG3]|uniref:nitrilase-related carbon-nitrogen hydrolase n=1 Tax=Streptomyces sp. McG3 TaxID=2725483 RepID=UPI002554504B|nr:nitrilase-related carbon-nitrogen hydrolase [Streptomyces sp. McG3]MBT2896502.1 hypothetical protein [Streptomyces sp. McG3]